MTVRRNSPGRMFVAANARSANRRCEIQPGFSPQRMRIVPAMPMFFAFFARRGVADKRASVGQMQGSGCPDLTRTRGISAANRAFSRTLRDVTTRARGRGGIGRRKGLKIPRWQRRAGSIPAVRTKSSRWRFLKKRCCRDTNVFFRTIRYAALLASSILAPGVCFAQETAWPVALMCQASVQSYFSLKEPPRQIDESWGWLIFRSSLGGVYDCQVRGNFISLKWKSHNGTMSNSNTQVDAAGAVLTVRPGGTGQWRFRRAADGYGLLSEGKSR